MPDDVQPDPGQGAEATGSPYDSYLQTVPEEAQEAAEQWFRDTSKGLDAKLQEAAELRNTLGPYKDVDLSGYDPEDLSQIIAWHRSVTASPDAFKQWLASEAKENGLTIAEEQALAEAEEQGELTPQQVEQLISQVAEQRLAPVQEQLTALQQEREIDVEYRAIETAFGEIRKELGRELTPEERKDILDLGMPEAVDSKGQELPAGDASWVKAGFERLKGLHATGTRLFVEEKTKTPGQSLTAGGTPALRPITDWNEANDALRERLRQQS